MSNGIEFRNITKRYGTDPSAPLAVKGISFEVPQGTLTTILGPSGCGKTTTLRMIAGLESPTSGEIFIGGKNVTTLGPAQRNVSMMFQSYALFPHMNVVENVMYGLRMSGLAKEPARTKAVEALRGVGLVGYDDRLPSELSGGQQQRVALARALAPKPQLMLLDEPFSNLDVELRERLAHEVRGILKAAQATALFVTHDQLEAFAIGDAIGVMHEGRLHQWDSAYTLYHQPATRFVADFIGHGVFTPATLFEAGGKAWAHTPLGDLTGMDSCPLPSAYPGGVCDVLLRADDSMHDDNAPLKAEVLRKAFRGSEFLYTLRLSTGETVLVHVPSHHDHQIGEWIGIRPQVDHLVTFARG